MKFARLFVTLALPLFAGIGCNAIQDILGPDFFVGVGNHTNETLAILANGNFVCNVPAQIARECSVDVRYLQTTPGNYYTGGLQHSAQVTFEARGRTSRKLSQPKTLWLSSSGYGQNHVDFYPGDFPQ